MIHPYMACECGWQSKCFDCVQAKPSTGDAQDYAEKHYENCSIEANAMGWLGGNWTLFKHNEPF